MGRERATIEKNSMVALVGSGVFQPQQPTRRRPLARQEKLSGALPRSPQAPAA